MAGSLAAGKHARLGLDPWNVMHEGISHYVPLSFGTVTILSGLVVLLLWAPLHQPLGFGTLVNVVLVGLVVDVSLWALPTPCRSIRIPPSSPRAPPPRLARTTSGHAWNHS